MLADTKLLLIIVCAIRATAFVAPRQRRGVVLAIRHASEDASVHASEDASVNAEEDVDDAALAASLQVAAKRTSSARDALEKRRRREARPQRAVDAPQKPTLAMRDSRVKSSMEPQQELRELFDEGSWGALPESELLTRLGYLFAASFLVAVGLVDFDPPDELSDPPSLADRVFLPLALGSLPPLVAVGRALVRWQYVDDRLAEDTLYFERTGWNDGFMARKDPDAAKRDAQARAAQTGPQLAVLRRCTAYAAGITVLSTAGFVFL